MLPPGSYQYKFVLDREQWVIEQKLEQINDGKGNLNNIVHVKSKIDSIANLHATTLSNLRYIRRIMNYYHNLLNKANATMFLHRQVENLFNFNLE